MESKNTCQCRHVPVNSTHPDYDANALDWLRARDVLADEGAVKSAGEKCLPRLDLPAREEYLAIPAGFEAAADLIRETGNVDPAHAQRACLQFALLQYMDVLLEHGDEIARNPSEKIPPK
jgi:hypothetical protein